MVGKGGSRRQEGVAAEAESESSHVETQVERERLSSTHNVSRL